MTEIFDYDRARRLTLLRQSTAPNVIRINPDTASFLRRYEDADVSRLKLLEAQRLRNESEAQTKLIKSQQKRLKKRFRSGKGLTKGRGKQQKEVIEKSPLEVEIDVQERRDKLRRDQQVIEQGDRRLQLEDFRQQREFFSAERDRQQRELQRQTGFISGQNQIAANQQIAIYNAARAELRTQAINDSRTAQAIANRQEQGRLEDQRADIQVRQIDANFERDREQRAVRYAEIDADAARYDRDVRISAEQRDQDIARIEAERADVAERVARDDAFRHAQLQEQQRIAIENLAQQQRDNTARHELEQNRINNQRAVDAERAITDREIFQGFTSAIQTLNTQRDQDPPRIGPTAQELANTVREGLRSRVGAGLQPQPQANRPQRGSAPTESTSSASSDLGTEAEEAIQIQDFPGDRTPRQTVAERRATRSPGRSPTQGVPSQGTSAARQPLTLEEQSGSSVSSSEEGLDPDTQRSLSIMGGRGAPLGRQRERQEGTRPGTLIPTGDLGRYGFPKLAARKTVEGRATSPTIGSEAIGGAIYEGIAGGEQEDEPIDRQGTSAGE